MSVTGKIRSVILTTFRLRRALGFVWRSSRGWTVANAALLVLQGVLPIVSLFLLRALVDAVVAAAAGGAGSADPAAVYPVLLAVAGVTLASGLARTLGTLVEKEQQRRVVDHMQNVIQSQAIAVDLEFYENARYIDTLHRAQEEAGFRPGIIVTALSTLLQNTISLAGIAWLLLTFRWPVFVVLLVALVPSLLVRIGFSEREYLRERRYTAKERTSAYFHFLLVGREMAKEVRMYGLGPTFMQRYQGLRQELRRIRFSLDAKNAWWSAAAHVFATVLVFGAYLWIVRDAVLGLVTVGGFVMFYQAFQRGQGFLQSVLGSLARLYENNLFLRNLYEFLDLKRRPVLVADASSTTPGVAGQRGGARIVFDRVSFTYPGTAVPVLQDVNLTIEPGQVVALVGLNGAGKTTLVKLLCRLYEVDQGAILLDGVDIRTLDPSDLRHRIGVIFQDYAMYNLTARDNIWFGNVAESDATERVAAAAEQAGIHEKIASLPEHYDTVLGRLFQNGHELSVGQWQKIALARAFFRDTDLVVLDEPTSSMDPQAEYELFGGFRRILKERSALLISHRMSTVRMADVIYTMSDGTIVEHGSHQELMTSGGVYAGLFAMQASNYGEPDPL